MNRIIYKNKDNSVAVLIPAQEVLDAVGLQAIAEKDVPKPYQYAIDWDIDGNPIAYEEYSTPYWLVMETDIPSDRTERNQWVLDGTEGEPDGFGGASNEFTDEQLLALYNAGAIT